MKTTNPHTLRKGVVNHRQILIGISGLLIGALVYLTNRPVDHVYFLSTSGLNTSLYHTFPDVFGILGNTFGNMLGNTLPDFLHVFSFILITAGMVSCGRRGGLFICAGWFLVDALFELGQKFSTQVVNIIPDTLAGIPYLENTKSYFLSGTYDSLDLAAIFIGTLTAYYFLVKTMNRRPNHVTTKNT